MFKYILLSLRFKEVTLNINGIHTKAFGLSDYMFIYCFPSVSRFRVERSTDQVMKPVNTDALSKWVGYIPADVISEMAEIAPMLARLGYDPQANPPDYTKPEPLLSPFNSSQVRVDIQKAFDSTSCNAAPFLPPEFETNRGPTSHLD